MLIRKPEFWVLTKFPCIWFDSKDLAAKFLDEEIAGKLNISLGGTHNALKYLTKEKILEVEPRGNMKFYRINDENPLVKQLKTTAVVEKLLPVIKEIKHDSKEIILFGSACRGEQTSGSDIDLFILTHLPADIKKIMDKYQKKLLLKPIIKTPNQLSELEIKEPEFYHEVRQGIKLL